MDPQARLRPKPEEDVYWCAADVGWVTGHSYIVYGPLANGATSVMYEGAPDYPDKDIWWEIIERYGVTIFYTAPTAIRACMKWGAEYPGKHDLSSLRLLGTVGEPINPKAWLWYCKVIGGERCPIVDTWWQTETGHIMITTLPGAQATKPGSAGSRCPGSRPRCVAEEGEEVAGDARACWRCASRGPGCCAPCTGTTTATSRRTSEVRQGDVPRRRRLAQGRGRLLLGDRPRRRRDQRLRATACRPPRSSRRSSRTRRSPRRAVIGQTDEDTGQAICAFVTLEGDARGLRRARSTRSASTSPPRSASSRGPKRIIWADDLPKTRSGKIMRRLLRDIAEGRELGDVTTLRDPAVVRGARREGRRGDEE